MAKIDKWFILLLGIVAVTLLITFELSENWIYKLKINMKKSTKKQLILQVATAMCSMNNKLSTKKLKIEMRNQYPNEIWNKYDNGEGVSDLFHELVNEGRFVSVHDNGTYQTYAHSGMRIADRKGDPYIADLDEVGANLRGTLANICLNTRKSTNKLAKALTKASGANKVKQHVIDAIAKILVASGSRTNSTQVKMQLRIDEPTMFWTDKAVTKIMDELVKDNLLSVQGGYYKYQYINSKVKKASFPTKRTPRKKAPRPMVLPKSKLVKKIMVSTNKPAQPAIKLNQKLTKALKTVAPVKKGSPLKKLTVVGNKVVPIKLPKNTITVRGALQKMQNSKGQFFTATFIKKDKTRRIMNCQYLKDQGTISGNMVKVTDAALRKLDPNDCIRNVNLNTLEILSIGGTKYRVK